MPVRRAIAHRVVLQVYPTVLSADFPVAQVQAFLEDAAGERIGSEGVELSASSGSLVNVTQEGGTLRANYQESELGGDEILAKFFYDHVESGVWSLETGWRYRGDDLEVVARTLNRDGRPVSNQQVVLRLGDEQLSAVSDEGAGSVVGCGHRMVHASCMP